MDRDFLKDNMSAYLDGELVPKQMHEFERDIQSYPDLFAELQTLQRLNKLALESKVPLPDDSYFDKLAGQIDSQIKREAPQERSRIVNFLLERRKTVAIISSVAAVFLIAVIGMNLYGPNAKRYPGELRNIELNRTIETKPKTDTVTVWPKHEQQIVPPPVADDEVKRDSVARIPRLNEADKEEKQSSSSSDIVPSLIIRQEPAPPVPVTDTITREYSTAGHANVKPKAKVTPSKSSRQSLSESVESTTPISIDVQNSSGTAFSPQLIYSRTEVIIPEMKDARFANVKDSEIRSIQPDTAQFHDTSGSSWDTYIRAFDRMNKGVYDGWRLSALTLGRDSLDDLHDSLQTWADSISIIGPGSWYAEQAYRSLQQKDISWENFQLWRAYIDHYLANTPDADHTLWNQRLTTLNEILERFLGKQIQR